MITIYGASDDLVEVDGCEGADEFGSYGYEGTAVHWRGDFIAPGGGTIPEQLRVYAIYDGCWHFSLGQVLEDVPLPPWPATFTQHERGDSVLLSIDAPPGTRLDNVWPARSEG